MDNIVIRPVQPSDNIALAKIIRNALEEFGANHPGTVYFDASTDHLSDIFQQNKSAYFVAEKNGDTLGGGGIFPTKGLPADTCELVKLYLSNQARGLGIGKQLMQQCLKTAVELGFKKVYLETMPELTIAIQMYIKFGFKHLSAALGNSGHHGCKVWMLKELANP
jgi:putative acetyltransferase